MRHETLCTGRLCVGTARFIEPQNPFSPVLHTPFGYFTQRHTGGSPSVQDHLPDSLNPAPSMARGGRQKAAVAAPVVKDPARYKVRARLIALAARQTHPFCGSSCVRLNPHELQFESLPLTDRAMRYLDAGGCLPLWDQVPVCPRRRGAARPPGALVGHPAWASLLPQCC